MSSNRELAEAYLEDAEYTLGEAKMALERGYYHRAVRRAQECVELCLKAAAAGHRILYAPRARAWHKVGASARKVGISYADPAAYYYLIQQTFPAHVYAYHLALFPLLLSRWAVLFLLRSRDRSQLRRFVLDIKRLLTRSGPT